MENQEKLGKPTNAKKKKIKWLETEAKILLILPNSQEILVS